MSKETKVGLLATTALLAVYLGFNFLKGLDFFSSNNVYCTRYAKNQGLTTASPVLINGMLVGKVRSIKILPDEHYQALVTFVVKKDIRLTDATTTRLISSSLLGTKAVELFIKEGKLLKNYATLPGQVELGLEEAFTESTLPTLKNAKDISLLVNQFVTELVENTGRINKIFANVEAVTFELQQSLHKNQQDFCILSQNLSSISGALSDGKQGVGALLERLNQLFAGCNGGEVSEVAEKLNNILGNVAEVLESAAKKEGSLHKMLDAKGLYKDVKQTLTNLNALLIDMKAHPWRYVSFSIFGKNRGARD